ncbi:MAG: GYD domain-containing protein [Pseudomonadota bacterium]|nr:GYD domain-containing protein [Pseudomonadota bacterium]
MTTYISQGNYTRAALQGMLDKPEDRAVEVAALAKAAGGKLLDYYITFGEYDFLVIMNSGKDESKFMGAIMAAAAGGGICNLKTTVAVSSKKAVKAMRAGKRIQKGFRSAGG